MFFFWFSLCLFPLLVSSGVGKEGPSANGRIEAAGGVTLSERKPSPVLKPPVVRLKDVLPFGVVPPGLASRLEAEQPPEGLVPAVAAQGEH